MITFDPESRPITEAMRGWRGRRIFPTDMGSAEIRGMAAELRRRAVFSAETTSASYLEEIAGVVDELLDGKINMATARLRLMRKLAELGYDPETGFPEDMGAIAPAERDSLRDLSSKRRLDLVLETNVRMAANFSQMKAGNTPAALSAYPAWELVRIYQREIPRGSPDSHSAGWQRRWQEAGDGVGWEGALEGGPMMALKGSPIWQALGDGEGGHIDTLDNPYPPFAFQSGMGWRAVPVAEWRRRIEDRGLRIEDFPEPKPMEGTLSPGQREVRSAFEKLSPDIREAIRKELGIAA